MRKLNTTKRKKSAMPMAEFLDLVRWNLQDGRALGDAMVDAAEGQDPRVLLPKTIQSAAARLMAAGGGQAALDLRGDPAYRLLERVTAMGGAHDRAN